MQDEWDIQETENISPTWDFQCTREMENAKRARIEEIGETAFNEETQAKWFLILL
jgi:hypothetical protein